MKRSSSCVLILVLSCSLTLMLVAAAVHYPRSAVGGPMDAAFRDGVFQGQLDAKHGRKAHLSTGRWSAEADRRLFVSGYLQAYGEMFGVAGDQPQSWQLAEQRAYRDGITDGLNNTGDQNGFKPPPRKTTPEPTADTQSA
jgi:hypothetical protein